MYKNFLKRVFDFIIVLCVLLIIWPFLLIVTILLLIFNEGAGAFFLQERPGYKVNPFKIIKFKTMNEKKGPDGKLLPDVQRITKFGSFVRKMSIDELPQLINVFIGDMSLVGPRPEVRHYVNYWTPEQMHVLDVRPGITDPASIKFRNENELMEQAEDPEDYYIHVIMQEKIRLYLEYVEHASFWYDIKLIFQTFKVIVTE